MKYPPRAVQGFYKKTELELLIQRRASRKSLAGAEVDQVIVDLTPRGPEGLFSKTAVDELVAVLGHLNATAIAA